MPFDTIIGKVDYCINGSYINEKEDLVWLDAGVSKKL